ncbi:MAG TPA: hypothetical protein VFW66_11790 [Gemmatimonadales bacterium]|nr:hypothetical protein [Gemmatimonadales bacterium]
MHSPAEGPLRALLQGAIDYAGLFPPARLDMRSAAAEYAAQHTGPDRWALGRFVVPAARLAELAEAMPDAPLAGSWQLSAISGPDLAADLSAITRFNEQQADRARVSAIELRAVPGGATSARAIGPALETIRDRIGAGIETYAELPIAQDPAPLIAELARSGGRAKVRTGGVTPDAFPAPDHLLRFIARAVAARVPFKATAGLHHALRGCYPLTYEPGSARAPMYGYLNLTLTAAGLSHGMDESAARRLLEESSAAAFRFEDGGVGWGDAWLTAADLAEARRDVVLGFGSCSFREPMDELRALTPG